MKHFKLSPESKKLFYPPRAEIFKSNCQITLFECESEKVFEGNYIVPINKGL